jgi:hypothetical protein
VQVPTSYSIPLFIGRDEGGTQDEKYLRGLHAVQEALTDYGIPVPLLL